MNASQSMTVARRLSLGFGLIILVLIAMVTVTTVGLSTINQQIYEITNVNAAQGRLASKMVDAAQEIRIQYRQLLLDSDPAKKKETIARLHKARDSYLKSEGEIKALFQKYAALVSPVERDLMTQVANQKPIAFASVEKLLDLDAVGGLVAPHVIVSHPARSQYQQAHRRLPTPAPARGHGCGPARLAWAYALGWCVSLAPRSTIFSIAFSTGVFGAFSRWLWLVGLYAQFTALRSTLPTIAS